MKDMVWNVYVDDINARRIKQFNIFNHYSFNEGVKKAYKKYKNDFAAFAEGVRRELQYYFWSKCEWEIVLSDFPPSDRFQKEKIDVYDQVMLNWDIFIQYVWDAAHARKAPTRKPKKEQEEQE
jgi:hypothetical protein